MASPTQWTRAWVDSRSWWWTGRPSMLQSMGLQSRTRLSDWIELNIVFGLPGGSAGKESTCNVGDPGLIPGLGRSPGEGNGCPLQYFGLENSMDCIVHGVAKSQTHDWATLLKLCLVSILFTSLTVALATISLCFLLCKLHSPLLLTANCSHLIPASYHHQRHHEAQTGAECSITSYCLQKKSFPELPNDAAAPLTRHF